MTRLAIRSQQQCPVDFSLEGASWCRSPPSYRAGRMRRRPRDNASCRAGGGLFAFTGCQPLHPDHRGRRQRALPRRQLGAAPRVPPGRVGGRRRCHRHGKAAFGRARILLPTRPRRDIIDLRCQGVEKRQGRADLRPVGDDDRDDLAAIGHDLSRSGYREFATPTFGAPRSLDDVSAYPGGPAPLSRSPCASDGRKPAGDRQRGRQVGLG
jgi:hypothetical protein